VGTSEESRVMDKITGAFILDRADAAPTGPLRGAVRHALRLSTAVIVAGLAVNVVPSASAAPFPAVFPLATLLPDAGGDGSLGFVLRGIHADDLSGISVSDAGDVNGDGIDDIIIGADLGDPGGRIDAGESYVVFGTSGGFPASLALASLFPAKGGDGSAGFVLQGVEAGDASGLSASGAGDVNGDGVDDIIVGAFAANPGGRTYAGESYIVFGRDTARVGNFHALFPLAGLLPAAGGDGSAGFVLHGIDANDFSGSAVSGAGDTNGDGIGDVIIGAFLADPGGQLYAGESYVIFGRDTARFGNFPALFPLANLLPSHGGDGRAGFVVNGVSALDYSGASVRDAGDVNGDGVDDLIIGAFGAGPSVTGEAYIVFGRDTARLGDFPAVFRLADLLPDGGGDGKYGFVLEGIDAGDHAGSSARLAGDVNGDGIDDVIVGAALADGRRQDAGESYVVFGRNAAQVGNFPAEFPLASLLPDAGGDGTAGFVLTGIGFSDESGVSVSGAGDVNGDGLGDLIIGASFADIGHGRAVGQNYVVFGRDTQRAGNFPATLPLASLLPGAGGDGSFGFVLNGIDEGDSVGDSVSVAGDINGDGFDDLILGARFASPRGRSSAGESYVVFGRSTPILSQGD